MDQITFRRNHWITAIMFIIGVVCILSTLLRIFMVMLAGSFELKIAQSLFYLASGILSIFFIDRGAILSKSFFAEVLEDSITIKRIFRKNVNLALDDIKSVSVKESRVELTIANDKPVVFNLQSVHEEDRKAFVSFLKELTRKDEA